MARTIDYFPQYFQMKLQSSSIVDAPEVLAVQVLSDMSAIFLMTLRLEASKKVLRLDKIKRCQEEDHQDLGIRRKFLKELIKLSLICRSGRRQLMR